MYLLFRPLFRSTSTGGVHLHVTVIPEIQIDTMATLLPTRRDPLNDVMPYELLRVAHSLIERGQNERYWAQVPVPKRPVGQVRFEVARQVATFAVPLLGLSLAWVGYGSTAALLALPVAWLVGFLLDMQLDRAIDQKHLRDIKIDAGRYRAVKWLSEQMSMRPEEVTIEVIRKMDRDFVIVQRIIDERAAQIASNKKAATTNLQGLRPLSQSGYVLTNTGNGIPVAAYLAEHAAVTDGAYDDSPAFQSTTTEFYTTHTEQEFNLSGLPMIEGTGIDIHGNMLGMNDQF